VWCSWTSPRDAAGRESTPACAAKRHAAGRARPALLLLHRRALFAPAPWLLEAAHLDHCSRCILEADALRHLDGLAGGHDNILLCARSAQARTAAGLQRLCAGGEVGFLLACVPAGCQQLHPSADDQMGQLTAYEPPSRAMYATLSPSLKSVTPGPTLDTRPAPSIPCSYQWCHERRG